MTETVSDWVLVPRAYYDAAEALVPYHITTPPTPDHQFVNVCNGDLRKLDDARELLANPPQNTDGEADKMVRTLFGLVHGGYYDLPGHIKTTIREAASALSAMKAENAALKSDLTRYIDIATKEATEAESLRAERDALAKALEPFAAVADWHEGTLSRDSDAIIDFVNADGTRLSITIADVRRARSTLQGNAK